MRRSARGTGRVEVDEARSFARAPLRRDRQNARSGSPGEQARHLAYAYAYAYAYVDRLTRLESRRADRARTCRARSMRARARRADADPVSPYVRCRRDRGLQRDDGRAWDRGRVVAGA